jgi:hypothetical protein
MPVCWGKQLIGVISLYATDPFVPEDEQVCRDAVAEIVDSANQEISARAPVLAAAAH